VRPAVQALATMMCGAAGDVRDFGEVGARDAGREGGDLGGIDVGCELHLLQMHVENLHATRLVRAIYQHLAIETAGTQQRGIEDLGAIGGGQKNQADAWVEAIHLGQQLVERLLLFVMTAG
jgi:hypothetical protein